MLSAAFKAHKPKRATVLRDGHGGSKGWGFVWFHSPEDCAAAVREMNGHTMAGRPIHVEHALSREELRQAKR